MTVDVRPEAIAVVEEELAHVLGQRQKGALVVAEIDPDGDGVVLARAARLDRPEQLTPQIEFVLKAADEAGLRPKLIVASAGVSGAKPLEERPDLVAVLAALDQEGCTWVAVRDADRVARSIVTATQFLDELDRREASVYVGYPARLIEKASLDRKIAFSLMIEMAADERSRVVERLRRGRELKRKRCS